MVAYPYGALFTGICLILAGLFSLGRHALLEPESKDYPKAPGWLRHSIFFFGVILVYLGLQFIWIFLSEAPDTVPPQPGPALQFLACALCLHKIAMFVNVLNQGSSFLGSAEGWGGH